MPGDVERPELKSKAREWYDRHAAQYREESYSADSAIYPANLIRLDLVLEELTRIGARRVLDIGCGSGYPLLRMLETGHDAAGFDFAPHMVAEAQTLLEKYGFPADRVWLGDVEERHSYRASGLDAVTALGVFPHVQAEETILENIRASLRPGGIMIVEFRNELFSAFSLNVYSYIFYREAFLLSLRTVDEVPQLAAAADAYFKRAFACSDADIAAFQAPPTSGESYTGLRAKFHNPLTIGQVFDRAGCTLTDLLFYHFHAVPPALEASDSATFRDRSQQLERRLARDWRGYFMASAFLAVARAKS